MQALLFLLVLVAPLLTGSLVAFLLREKNFGYVEKYASGFISLIGVLLAVVLVMLKLDKSFAWLSTVFLICVAGLSVLGLAFLGKPAKSTFRRQQLYFIVPAVLLWAYAVLYLAPSYINDDSFEIVANSVATNTIFEYSSMTGQKMVNGLPIFSKIYVMPVFEAVLCSTFKVPMWLVGGILIPTIVYVVNLFLMYRIGKELKASNLPMYMITYLLILMNGTYLPANGIPVTAGYAILREGYSGYAVFFGLVLPLLVLLALKKRFLYAAVTALPVVSLVKLDRVFYALKEPITSFESMNSAGKLVGLFIVSAVAILIVYAMTQEKVSPWIVFCPSAMVSYAVVRLGEFVQKGAKKIAFCIGVAAIIMSTSYFSTFSDAVSRSEEAITKEAARQAISTIDDFDFCLYAPMDIMAAARRLDGRVKTLVGRDIETTYLQGADYESHSEYRTDYYHYMLNYSLYNTNSYLVEHTEGEIMRQAKLEGMKYLVLPERYHD